MRGSVASYPIFPAPAAVLGKPLPLSTLRITKGTITDLAWILFIIGAGSAARPLGVQNVERYFWLAADLIVVLFLLHDYRPLLTMSLKNKLLMTWPAIATLSALWSYNPGISLYHGLQLFMTTMVGFLFCSQIDRKRIPRILFLGLLVCLLSSVAFKFVNPHQAYDGNGAFQGVFTHKNVLGSMMTLLIFTSTCLFFAHWRPLLTLAAAAAAAIVLVMSKSGTALIMAVLTLMPIMLAFLVRRGPRTLSAGVGAIIVISVLACTAIVFAQIDVFGLALASVGKDATLTGRTILWGFGADAFLEHPWLGFGYKGYWESTQSTVFYLRYVIGQDLWFFHNNFIEMAVAFGFMGPILLIAGILQGYGRTLRVFLRDHDYISLWYVLFMVCVTIDSFVEYPLFLNHGLYQFLFVAVVASSGAALSDRKRTRRHPGRRNDV